MNLAELVTADLDPSSLDNRDPEFIRRVALPLLEPLRLYYFRSEGEGVENLPDDPRFICIGNHNGGPIMPDAWMMLSWLWTERGADYPGYALVHDAPLRIPIVRNFLMKFGALRASIDSARAVLDRGASILVYPGGELDCLKSFWRRNVVDLRGRTGFIRLALERGVPIVPFVNAGGHEVYLTLFSSERLAQWTGLAQRTRVRTIPFNLGLPWGAWITGFLPYIPLPAKLTYKVGEPMYLGHDPEKARDAASVRRIYGKVTTVMQRMLDDLVSRRRFPVLG